MSFRNLAYGRTCVLGKELFGSAVEQASLQGFHDHKQQQKPTYQSRGRQENLCPET